MTEHDAETTEEIPYSATVQHLRLLHAKVERLNELRRQAEDQLIHRVAVDYQAGRITVDQVYALYQTCRGIVLPARTVNGRKCPGFGTRWDDAVPTELRKQRLPGTTKHRPDPDGNWRGTYPLVEGVRYPPYGVNVVYVLYDADNNPCYVGSTSQFRGRLDWHHRDGKRFTSWLAHPCDSREEAYQLEERLLNEHKPYLNRKRGR